MDNIWVDKISVKSLLYNNDLKHKNATNSISLEGWATISAGSYATITRNIPAQPANTMVDFCLLFANNAPLVMSAYLVSGNTITFIIWNLGSTAHVLDVTDYVMVHFKSA